MKGGISTPLIAQWPAAIKNKGGITGQPGHIIDVMATCCDVAGVPYPSSFKGKKITELQGRSLIPVFNGVVRKQEPYFWEHFGNRALRSGNWKLVAKENAPWELYDMKTDRTELNNLIGSQPNIARKLINQYKNWAKKVGVKE